MLENKNMMWVAVGVAFFAGLLIGFVAMRQRAISTMEAFKLTTQRQIEDAKKEAGTQNGQLRLGRVYVLEGGQLMQEEGTKVVVGETLTLGDGATITVTGLITRPDGSTVQLGEGESVSEDGTLMEAAMDDSMMMEAEPSEAMEDDSMMMEDTSGQ
jgi:hypothetical protein